MKRVRGDFMALEEVGLTHLQFNRESINEIGTLKFNEFPVVYILHKHAKTPKAYIGESVQIRNRLRNHIADKQKRDNLDQAIIIEHDHFNRSATYNIETNLINYFIADGKYKILNKSQITSAISHNYYEKSKYDYDIFGALWQKLMDQKIVNQSLESLNNKDIFKLSPYKELSESQLLLKEKIIDFCKAHIKGDKKAVFFIKGEAGTGKSVVLSSTFNTIQDEGVDAHSSLHKLNNFLLVNHNEMLKTYETISESLPNLKKKNFMKPTPFINKSNNGEIEADITFIDEAHLLLTRPDKFNSYHGYNQLEDIIENSRITIAVFDEKQFLKAKSYWSSDLMKSSSGNVHFEEFELTDQFRIRAKENVVAWIDSFVEKNVLPIPSDTGDYELKVFDNAGEMKKAIEDKNEKHQLSRIVATFDYVHKKDGKDYYIEEPGFKAIWNRTEYKRTWAEEKDTINEVGSIYTIQGFDLNYVGVILGPSISYDEEKNELVVKPENYKDTEAFRDSTITRVEYNIDKVKEQIILNSINVLMKRGVKGLYIYASDEKLRRALQRREQSNE